MPMTVRCPECKLPVDVFDESAQSVSCQSCGNEFSLAGSKDQESATLSVLTPDERKIAELGRFRLLKKLGEGSYGSVWEAEDRELSRLVALKLPKQNFLSDEDRQQFFRDARMAAQLRHPNIVIVHDIGVIDEQAFIVSELIEGTDLKHRLNSAKRPSIREAVEICTKISDALQHAHEKKVIHRDLKPGNVMLPADNQPKVIDFGLARRDVSEATLTVQGMPLGSPGYMPPEQASGAGSSADGRADIYSLGVILFEMLTGERPFRGQPKEIIEQHIHDAPPSPRKLNRLIPRDLEVICLRCLEKERGRRFPSAKELGDELRRWLREEPILSRPVGLPTQAWLWCRRNRNHAVTIVAAVIAIVGITASAFAWLTVAWQSERSAHLKADALAKSEHQARHAAVARLQEAREAVDLWLTDLSDSLQHFPGVSQARLRILQQAARDYERFAAAKSDDPELELERGRVLVRLGEVKRALQQLNESRRVFDDAANLFSHLNATANAKSSLTDSERLKREADLEWANCQVRLGLVLRGLKQSEEAERKFDLAIQKLHALRDQDLLNDRFVAALRVALFNKAGLYLDSHDLVSAQTLATKSLEIAKKLAEHGTNTDNELAVVTSQYLLGRIQSDGGQHADARDLALQSLKRLGGLIQRDPRHVRYLLTRVEVRLLLAKTDLFLGLDAEELQAYEQCLSDLANLVEWTEHEPAFVERIGLVELALARKRHAQLDLERAAAQSEKARQRFQSLVDEFAENEDYKLWLASSEDLIAQIQADRGDNEQAVQLLKKVATRAEQIVERHPESSDARQLLWLSECHLAEVLGKLGSVAEAHVVFERLIARVEPLVNGELATSDLIEVAAYVHEQLGHWLATHPSEQPIRGGLNATASFRVTAKLLTDLTGDDSAPPQHRYEFAKFLVLCPDPAVRDPQRSMKLAQQALDASPQNPDFLAMLGAALIQLDRFEDAKQQLASATKTRGQDHARDLLFLALAEQGQGHHDEAHAAVQRAESWMKSHAPDALDLQRLRTAVLQHLAQE